MVAASLVAACGASLCLAQSGLAGEPDGPVRAEKPRRSASAAAVAPVRADKPQQRIRTAVERGLRVVETAARNYPKHRQCYSCHHQTLPMLAMKSAKAAGFKTDDDLFRETLEFTRKSFRGRIENLRAGKGIGGRATTVGYGLWTLQIAGEEPDELSTAMVAFLLKTQERTGRWRPPSNRPPMEESDVTCTLFALYGMEEHRNEPQRKPVAEAGKRARTWLQKAAVKSTEDAVMRLYAMHLLGSEAGGMEESRKAVLGLQRENGGWGQLPGMDADAYATGQALFVLLATGAKPGDEPVRAAIRFLLRAQKPDGSWYVKTRARPVQVYFDNGDPHGKSQFISIPATSWATAALADALVRR